MSKPLELSQSRRLTMPLAFVALIVGVTYAFAVGYSRLIDDDRAQQLRIESNQHQLGDHEQRLRSLENINLRIDEKLDRLIELQRRQRQPPP